jgi:hypothetical protein
MKKQSAVLRGLGNSVAFILLSSSFLLSCKDETHEVVTTSCVDNKPDSTGYTRELNNINHVITLQRALELTENYARNKDSILSGAFGTSKDLLPDYETFNLKSIDSLVCQDETIGFRMYLGLDENKKIRLVLAGVDANGEDVLQQSRREKGSLKQSGLITTASAPPPPAGKNDLLLESGQRHP